MGISGLTFGSLKTKCYLGVSHVARHKVYYKGEVVASPPSPSRGEFCESMFARGLSVHQNVPTTH